MTMRTAEIVPKDSNSPRSQSSSMFHEREPTKRFLEFSSAAAAAGFSVLAFLTVGSASVSALRFLESAAGSESSESLSESLSESESESLSEALALSDSDSESESESEESESESESESSDESDWERKEFRINPKETKF